MGSGTTAKEDQRKRGTPNSCKSRTRDGPLALRDYHERHRPRYDNHVEVICESGMNIAGQLPGRELDQLRRLESGVAGQVGQIGAEDKPGSRSHN